MNLAIIGTGHVGLVTGACFAERGHRVMGVDNDVKKIAVLKKGRAPFFEPGLDALIARHRKTGRLAFTTSIADGVAFGEVVFICVPTPTGDDGRADLTAVEFVSREIARSLRGYRLVVEKSTAPVRTCEHVRDTVAKYARRKSEFDVASNPEFLREGSAVKDTLEPDRIVIGVESPRADKLLRALYKGFGAPILATDVKSTELIKHAANAFLSMKISYANALAALCDIVGADVAQVTKGIGLDKRIGPDFLRAGIGFGGSCFPKDVRAFEAISREVGYDFGLLREVLRINREARERFLKTIEKEMWVVRGKTIALLGLAFKADTDDLRESVAIAVGRELLAKGAKVKAYDPQAMGAARGELKGATFVKSATEALRRADAAVIATEWPEFAALDWKKIRPTMAHATVFDGRNLLDPAAMRKLGYTYRSIGRP